MTPEIYSIKRHGTTVDKCDNEPVQTPGCIQPNGALFVLRPADLTVAQVSENSKSITGFSPEELLNQPITKILGEEVTQGLREFLSHNSSERNPLLFDAVSLAAKPGLRFDAIVHGVNGSVVLELEPSGRSGPRKAASPDYFVEVKRTLTRISTAPSLLSLCSTLAEEIRRMTGLDRVMIYRFHEDESGEVFAESRREGLQAWLNFRYPAHDIPKPAREIFKRIWIRPVPDVKAELAEMVPLAHPDTGKPLEMTHCALRGASVMYTEYLENMGVGAALTMSLKMDGQLWGLVACHHYSPTDLPYPLRTACEFLAQTASLQLKGADEREHAHYRQEIEGVHLHLLSKASLSGKIDELIEGKPNLLKGISSGGVALFTQGGWKVAGKTPTTSQLTELLKWLQTEPTFNRSIFVTDHLSAKFPPAQQYADLGSGILAAGISAQGNNALIWFRPETIQTFTWAGNPNDLPTVAGVNGPRLTPRKSFELWRESVHNRSLPWNSAEVDSARRLISSVLDLLASRTEELTRLNAELARSNEELDAFAYVASHDLKEPLRGIHKYASQLIEESKVGKVEGDKNKERLDNVLRLTNRMDDLINSLLHFSRVGHSKLELQPFDLNDIVQEAREMLGSILAEKNVVVRIARPLPTIVCDRIRVREIFANLLSNAVKYNTSNPKQIEIGYVDAPVEVRVANGPTQGKPRHVFFVRDNGIGIERQYFEKIFKVFKRLHVREAYGGGSGAGLAIVKKLVGQHSGKIWVESETGKGTIFWFTLSADDAE